MPLFARSFQELMTDSLEDLSTNTTITRLSAGGKARAILESVNRRIEEQFEIFDLNMARAFVSSAPGQFLDLIGALLGVPRELAVAASAESDMEVFRFYVESGTFGSINGGQNITIEQGQILSTRSGGRGILYRALEQVTLSAASSSVFFGAEAVVPGEGSNVGVNALVYHNFTDYQDYLNNTLLVQNLHQIGNGKNLESDANYRFRIVNRVLEGEAANLTAVRLAALSTPGVADVILIRRYRGIGTFGVIIKAVTPTVSDTLVAAVEANILKVQSMGQLAFVLGPKETGVSLRTTVHYSSRLSEDELTQIEDSLKTAITDFVNGLDIGETLLVNRLAAELFAVSSDIANLGDVGKPFEEMYIYVESRLQDNKLRQTLLTDYVPAEDERVIIEPGVSDPIVFERAYVRR
jgi:uncharacterized phage protein gp47/JayE